MTNIIVFGYQETGHRCLQHLIERGEKITGVFTHEDSGDENIFFPSVGKLAKDSGIQVFKPIDVNTLEWIETISELAPDLIFSFYYRQLISPEILNLATLGSYNMHGSLLPKYRGRSPVNWAIIHGETETGVTLHEMVDRPDAGRIVGQEKIGIADSDTAVDVNENIAAAAVRLLSRLLDPIKNKAVELVPQDETTASYFGRRTPDDGRIDWTAGHVQICNLVRAVTHPYPGAFTEVLGRRLYIWRARRGIGKSGPPGHILETSPLVIGCEDGAVECLIIQWANNTETDGAISVEMLGQRIC